MTCDRCYKPIAYGEALLCSRCGDDCCVYCAHSFGQQDDRRYRAVCSTYCTPAIASILVAVVGHGARS